MKRLTLTTTFSALALVGSAAFAQTGTSPSRPAAAPGTGADRCGSMTGAAKEACMRDAKAPLASDGAGNAAPNSRDAGGTKPGSAGRGTDMKKGSDMGKGTTKGSSGATPKQVPPQGSVGPGAGDPSGSDTPRGGMGTGSGTSPR